MRVIILQVSSGPGDVKAHVNAHALYEVKAKLHEKWGNSFVVLHTDEYSLLIANNVIDETQATGLEFMARKFFKKETE